MSDVTSFKGKEEREAAALNYGEGKPAYFNYVFLICMKADPETGGILEVSYQTDNVDLAVEKIKQKMGVQHIASRKDVLAACRDIVTNMDQQSLAEELAFFVTKSIEENESQARKTVQDFMDLQLKPGHNDSVELPNDVKLE